MSRIKHILVDENTHAKVKALSGVMKINMGDVIKKIVNNQLKNDIDKILNELKKNEEMK